MTTHEMNHACKHDFVNIEHLSRLQNNILIVMTCRYFPFDVNPITIFKVMIQ